LVIWRLSAAHPAISPLTEGFSRVRLALFLFFIVLPVIEIALFIEVGGEIGVWPTLALVVGAALLGASLFRVQGFLAWKRMEEAIKRGEPPVAEMFEGLLLFAAALLLILPGFFSDAVALLLLVPPLRRFFGREVARRTAGSARFTVFGAGMDSPRPPPPGQGPVIDGEAEEVDADEDEDRTRLPPNDDSPWRQ
jgi:UPF0716 protein FxsA